VRGAWAQARDDAGARSRRRRSTLAATLAQELEEERGNDDDDDGGHGAEPLIEAKLYERTYGKDVTL